MSEKFLEKTNIYVRISFQLLSSRVYSEKSRLPHQKEEHTDIT